MRIRIDIEHNRLEADGTSVQGSHRWEALTLALLLRAQGQLVTRSTLQSEMHGLGQRTKLDRTGIRRLFAGIERLMDGLCGDGSFGRLIRFEPRHRTVGPWLLLADEAVHWELVANRPAAETLIDRTGSIANQAATPASLNACRLPSLFTIDPEDLSGAFALVELLFKADAMFLSGHMGKAASLLKTAGASRWITPEGRCIIQLRMARLLKRKGQYDEATDLVNEILAACTRQDFPDPGLATLARHLQRRIRYDRRPVDYETLGMDPLFTESSPLPDLRAMGEAESLEGLLMRRRASAALSDGRASPGMQEARALLSEAQRHMAAALYWAASARDHENSQNFAFNIGLVNSSLHELGDESAALAAFRAYRLGLQLREDFCVGRDSVWDHICIGKLWLGLPDLRAEFESELAFELPQLSEPKFYLDALKQAQKLGETRQQALCCVNLWRFAQEGSAGPGSGLLMQTARRHVQGLLQVQPELHETLRGDAPETLAEMFGAGAPPATPAASCERKRNINKVFAGTSNSTTATRARTLTTKGGTPT